MSRHELSETFPVRWTGVAMDSSVGWVFALAIGAEEKNLVERHVT